MPGNYVDFEEGENGLRRRRKLNTSTKDNEPQHIQQAVKVSIPRQVFQELLRGMGAFAFTMLSGQLFGAFGLDLPKLIASKSSLSLEKVAVAMTAAFNPVNDLVGKFMHETAQDSLLTAKIMMAQKLNMDLQNAAAIVNPKKQLVLDLMNGNTADIDPISLAKKMDISEEQARILLNRRTWEDVIISFVKDGGIILLSIGMAGLTGLGTAYLPITSPFAQQLVAAATGQTVARLTQFFAPKLMEPVPLPKNQIPSERTALLQEPMGPEESKEILFDYESIVRKPPG